MTDVHTPAIRSKNMKAIKARNTRPELLVRRGLFQRGFRFRLHRKDLPGKPDIVLKKYHALIFINGCFWHGHQCHLSKVPSTRREFWLAKISANMKRDLDNSHRLLASEWRYAVIWECALKGKTRLDPGMLLDDLEAWLCDGRVKFIEFCGQDPSLV